MTGDVEQVDPRVARTRDEVRGAVLRLLATDGAAAVTHQRVAEASGVSRATVYRHWPDRTELLLDACLAIRPAPPAVAPSGDLRTDLLTLVTAGARQLTVQPLLPQLIAVLAAAEDDADVRAARERLSSLHDTPLGPVIEDAVARGALPADLDPDVAIATLVGPLLALRWVRGRELTDALVATVVDGWLRAHAV